MDRPLAEGEPGRMFITRQESDSFHTKHASPHAPRPLSAFVESGRHCPPVSPTPSVRSECCHSRWQQSLTQVCPPANPPADEFFTRPEEPGHRPGDRPYRAHRRRSTRHKRRPSSTPRTRPGHRGRRTRSNRFLQESSRRGHGEHRTLPERVPSTARRRRDQVPPPGIIPRSSYRPGGPNPPGMSIIGVGLTGGTPIIFGCPMPLGRSVPSSSLIRISSSRSRLNA